jgi:glycerate dehydrogenase
MKITVLDGHCLNPGDLNWDALSALGELTVHDRTPADAIVERCAGAAAAFTNKTPFSEATLDALPDLKYIGVLATGYNIVDVRAAAARGVTVTNIPTYGTHSVAQFAIALLLELCHSEAVHAGEWSASPDWSFWKTPQVELAGKVFGVVGFGRIGRQTASIAAALGMHIVAYDTNRSEPPLPGVSFRWMELDDLLAASDVVSLHCPLFPDNRGFINAQRLKLMKPTSYLLNTSRGPLIVEADLAEALNAGWIAGAGIDVIAQEPPVDGSPLFGARNCILTPHIAWATLEARARLMDIAVTNFKAFLNAAPVNVVS